MRQWWKQTRKVNYENFLQNLVNKIKNKYQSTIERRSRLWLPVEGTGKYAFFEIEALGEFLRNGEGTLKNYKLWEYVG